MPQPRVYRTEAIVLKMFDYGEADRILTVYTPSLGKLRVLAKGVRRTKSRKSGHLDLFVRSTMLIARGRQLDIVTQAESIEHFSRLRLDLHRVACAHYCAELIDGFAMEGQANYPAYALLVAALRRLESGSDATLVMRAFEIQLLGVMGYRPQLHRCLQCNELLEARSNYFSSRLGGALCPGCGAVDRGSPALSAGALKLMRNLQTNEAAVLGMRGLPLEASAEVEKRLQEYIAYRLETRPRSITFLDRLKAEALQV